MEEANNKLCIERQRRTAAEIRLNDIKLRQRDAAERRAAEKKEAIMKGCAFVHKHRLYERYHREDTKLYPRYFKEKRPPKAVFHRDAYDNWMISL
ncbi:MAG: hypothetical protein WCK51_15980 [Armatimonadota bacterium]